MKKTIIFFMLLIVGYFSLYATVESDALHIKSDYESDTPVLGAPLNFNGVVFDDNQYMPIWLGLVFTWEHSEYENTTLLGYNFYRNHTLVNSNPLNIPPNHNPEYWDDEVSHSPDYYLYYVTAVYTDGESEPSNSFEFDMLNPVHGAVTDLEANVLSGINILLQWSRPEYENTMIDSYTIWVNDSGYDSSIGTGYMLWGADGFLKPYTTYFFYVTVNYVTGKSEPSNKVSARTGNISENDESTPIFETKLGHNYPNPFNPSTLIAFDLATEGIVRIDIFNIRGQRVRTIVNEHFGVGSHSVEWHGIDENGREAASGIYFYRMQAENETFTRRMVLLK